MVLFVPRCLGSFFLSREDMSRVSPRAVFISKPAEVSFAEAMSRLRMWLDNRKVQPTSFRLTTAGQEHGFEISFEHAHEAAVFDASFAWHLPPA
jgi:outer membrane lipoprotein-sorting protein